MDVAYISSPAAEEAATFPLPPGVGVGLSRCPHGSPLTLRRRCSLIAPAPSRSRCFIDERNKILALLRSKGYLVVFLGHFDGESLNSTAHGHFTLFCRLLGSRIIAAEDHTNLRRTTAAHVFITVYNAVSVVLLQCEDRPCGHLTIPARGRQHLTPDPGKHLFQQFCSTCICTLGGLIDCHDLRQVLLCAVQCCSEVRPGSSCDHTICDIFLVFFDMFLQLCLRHGKVGFSTAFLVSSHDLHPVSVSFSIILYNQ